MWRRLKSAQRAAAGPLTHGGVVGQAWRGRGPREALLARALAGIDVKALDRSLGEQTGELLAAAGQSDVIDAALVLLTHDGDQIATSDVEDLQSLAKIWGRHIELIPV